MVIPTTSLVVTTVHGLRLRAGKIEARLCDRDAGSRGSLLLRLRRIALAQGSGDATAKTPSPKSRRHRRGQHGGSGRSQFQRTESPAASGAGWSKTTGTGGTATAMSGSSLSEDAAAAAAGGGGGFNPAGERCVDVSDSSSGSSSDVDVSDEDDDDDVGNQLRFMDGFGSHPNSRGYTANNYNTGGGGLPPPPPPSPSPLAHVGVGAGLSTSGTRRIDLAMGFAATSATGDVPNLEAPLVRAKSARSTWTSRGGVPPSLELLPSHSNSHDGVLASLGESSADEGEGDSSGDNKCLPEVEASVATAAGRGVSGDVGGDGGAATVVFAGADAGADAAAVDGGREDDDAAAAAAHRQVGSGKWDEHLQAITRAAWLGSKQASSRGFNSTASSVSAASASGASIPMSPSAAAAAAAVAASAGATNRPTSLTHSDSFSSAGGSRGIFDRPGGGAAPTLLPRPQPPTSFATATTVEPTVTSASPDAAVGDSSGSASRGVRVIDETARKPAPVGDDAGMEASGSEGVGRTRREAAAAADERVAGSGFLYRVVIDGLNILITLRLR